MIIDFTKDIKNPFGLKPCPFCGANAEMKVEPHIPASKGYDYTPRCTVTGCCGRSAKKYTNEKQAIYRWNRRADEQEGPKGRWYKTSEEKPDSTRHIIYANGGLISHYGYYLKGKDKWYTNSSCTTEIDEPIMWTEMPDVPEESRMACCGC